MATVNIIVLVPSDKSDRTGSLAKQKLHIKLTATKPAITLFSLAGGIIMAINIPNKATLRAATTLPGKIFHAITPMAVPIDHPGIARTIAPYV